MTGTSGAESRSSARNGFFDLTPETLSDLLTPWGEPTYRAEQMLRWVYRDGARSYADMSNLPKALRTRLDQDLPLYTTMIVRSQEAGDGTAKQLLRWPDGTTTECVLIRDGQRRTACISTQVGCPVGCVFCASGLDGLQGQLTAGQIVEQAMRVRELCEDSARLSNVVFMGHGEPLANYAATLQAVRTINAEWGLGVGARKITISTVGLPKQMRRLAEENLQVTLALSLHAPTDELRRRLIPWAERVTIESLVEAANYYFERTGREITLEYVLLGGINDSPDHAAALVRVARGMRGNINLLSYNPVEGLPFERPTAQVVQRFLAALREGGMNAHVRHSRGLDIDGACGQLRRREERTTGPATVERQG